MPQPIIPGNRTTKVNKQPQNNFNQSFAEILNGKVKDNNSLKFSAHAQKRLAHRNIKIDDIELSKLENALHKAKEKGAKESLVLIDDRAYVISVPNKVVITAVDQENLKENVFTNIDSAIIM